MTLRGRVCAPTVVFIPAWIRRGITITNTDLALAFDLHRPAPRSTPIRSRPNVHRANASAI
jgi:hypothetical protein